MRQRSFRARARPAQHPSADGSAQAEFLIDQCQKLAAIYDGRRSDADSQANTVLTAAVTLAALIVTASATLSATSTGWAIAAMVALTISAAIAVWERSGSGLRPLGYGWEDALRKLFHRPARAGGPPDARCSPTRRPSFGTRRATSTGR